ncbi:unnamed protein product (macronuclear) [Paramecium tetraurelia]|uniref:Uncharacterized protein n=1 Tax=Paramecium tetraurelia TaxID=5888 RepID=A0DJE7_PARTE|nr:uncharacterized protein GSPATT00017508001 [Paramecium tetraurelia]CAK83164.1 unnamed protein product [Paramecium tetraurelia]|eukprot:XP_001450561.1 hypothetical protein (macronuclear) [Paramecium tetraurelia strain d4-2]
MNDELAKETFIVQHQAQPFTYLQILKALQPLTIKTFRFNIPEISIFNQGEVELFISQRRTNLYGQYKQLRNLPLYRLKILMPKNGCICKYVDQNLQIMTDAELTILLNKRRVEPIWKDILYLQSQHLVDQRVLYIAEQDDSTTLYKRAYTEVGILTKDIVIASSQYIADEEEDQYERSLPQEQLCQYYTYKIIHFLEKVRTIKITHGIFKWSVENFRSYYFVDSQNVSYKNIVVNDLKQNTKQQNSLQLIDSVNDEVVKQYTTILNNEYQKKKQQFGFNENQFNITKDRETEKVFKEIHKGSNIQYNQLFQDLDSFTKYEGILIKQIKQKHRIKIIKPRERVMTIQNSSPPQKTLPVRPMTQQRQRTPTYKHYKSKLKYNTLPYLLQY